MDHGRHGDGGRDSGQRDHRGPGRDDGGRRDDRSGPGGREERGGPPDTRFLQLEVSQLMYEEASSVAREAVRDLLREAAMRRIDERFGMRLEALARLAVDEMLDDVEANLDIEARVADRAASQGRREEQLRDLFARRRGEGGERRDEGPRNRWDDQHGRWDRRSDDRSPRREDSPEPPRSAPPASSPTGEAPRAAEPPSPGGAPGSEPPSGGEPGGSAPTSA